MSAEARTRDAAGRYAHEDRAPRPHSIGRFMSKVAMTEGDACWVWTAQLDQDGYPRFKDQGRVWSAYRWAHVTFIGPIPDGMQVDHLCRNRACVNPDHLEAVTPRENVLRSESPAAINAQKTHCVHGHELSGQNLGVTLTGRRLCRACRRAIAAASRKRRSGAS